MGDCIKNFEENGVIIICKINMEYVVGEFDIFLS